MTPFVSVLIPTLNRAALLEKSVESALECQRLCKEKLEIVVVNNASDDGTDVLEEKFQGDALRWYNFSHRVGMKENWQRGLELVKGQWLLLLSDDDILMPEGFKTCFDMLAQKHEYFSMLIGSAWFNDHIFGKTTLGQNASRVYQQGIDFIKDIYLGKISLALASVFFNMEAMKSAGGFSRSEYQYVIDMDMICRIGLRFGQVATVDTVVSQYSISRFSLSYSKWSHMIDEVKSVNLKWYALLAKNFVGMRRELYQRVNGMMFHYWLRYFFLQELWYNLYRLPRAMKDLSRNSIQQQAIAIAAAVKLPNLYYAMFKTIKRIS